MFCISVNVFIVEDRGKLKKKFGVKEQRSSLIELIKIDFYVKMTGIAAWYQKRDSSTKKGHAKQKLREQKQKSKSTLSKYWNYLVQEIKLNKLEY